MTFLQDVEGVFAFAEGIAGHDHGVMPSFQWATRDRALADALSRSLRESAWSRATDAAHVFDLHPPTGKAGLVLALEGVPDAKAVNLIFTGNLLPWRAAFDGAGLSGGYVEAGDGAKIYVRMLTGARVGEPGGDRRLRRLFGDALRGYPVLLRPIDDEDGENTTVLAMRVFLLALPSIWLR